MTRTSPRFAVPLMVAALLAVGCGGNDGDKDATGGTTAPSTTSSSRSSTETSSPETSAAAPSGEPVPSPGCDEAKAGAVREEKRTIDVGGTERWFLLTNAEPEDGTPMPLVLDMHGLAEGAQVHTMMSAFSDLAVKEGFAVVFPSGTGSPVRWETGIDPKNKDVAFLTALLDTLGEDLCLDESRVYATGLSNGAMMSSLLGCTMADRIAAIAPVAGLAMPEGCEPNRAMPVLSFHGTADEILLFNGGVGDALGQILGGKDGSTTAPTTTEPADLDGEGYPATAAEWADRNGCEPDAADEKVTEEVTRRVYDCPAGADVEFVIVVGGGHTWPGSEFSKNIANIVGFTTFDIDATEEIWKFFERFQLPSGS